MDKKILFQGTIEGTPFIKFQTKEIIESTQNGLIYMNSLKHYRDLYKDSWDETIGDPYEGKMYIHEADFIIPDKGIKEHLSDYAFPTANENDFVYCLFSINPNKYSTFQFGNEIKAKMPKEYDTALVIMKPDIFFERIVKKSQEDEVEIQHAYVKYYDEKIDDIPRMFSLLLNGIENVAFHKRKQYEYQQEYRFTSPKQERLDHIKLNIGDIRDISVALPANKLFESSIFKQK